MPSGAVSDDAAESSTAASDKGSDGNDESDGEYLSGVDSDVDDAKGNEGSEAGLETIGESVIDELHAVNGGSGSDEEKSAGANVVAEEISAGLGSEDEGGAVETAVNKVDRHGGVRNGVVSDGSGYVSFDEGKPVDGCEGNGAVLPQDVVERPDVSIGADGDRKRVSIDRGGSDDSDPDDSDDTQYLPEEELEDSLSSDSGNSSQRKRGTTGMIPRILSIEDHVPASLAPTAMGSPLCPVFKRSNVMNDCPGSVSVPSRAELKAVIDFIICPSCKKIGLHLAGTSKVKEHLGRCKAKCKPADCKTTLTGGPLVEAMAAAKKRLLKSLANTDEVVSVG